MISWSLFKANVKSTFGIWMLITLVFIMYYAIILTMYNPENMLFIQDYIKLLPEVMVQAMGFDEFGTTLFSAIAGYLYGFLVFLFPIVLSVVVNHKLIASHVEKGSMAYILSSPLSRGKIYRTQMLYSIVAITDFFIVYTAIAIGIAELMFPGDLDILDFILLNVNVWALYIALGGIGLLFSALANDSRFSLSFGIGVPVSFFILQMLSKADEALEFFKYGTLFTLFDPKAIPYHMDYVTQSIFILLSVGLFLYTLGGIIFSRKNMYV